jgi:hypothetical protein
MRMTKAHKYPTEDFVIKGRRFCNKRQYGNPV